MKRYLRTGLCIYLAVGAVYAQSANRPLNLKLPPQDLPAASASTAAATPGAYYGDHSDSTVASDAKPANELDDGKAHVHGSVATGIGYGKGVGSTSWNGANLDVTKNYGNSDHPTVMDLSISVMKVNDFGGGRFGH